MTALIKDTQRLLKTDKRRIREITESLLTYLKLPGRDISILFVDNRAIEKLNGQYFNKHKPTNVISFSYLDEDGAEGAFPAGGAEGDEMPCEMIGDIVISLEKAREEADTLGIPFYERLLALIIHGILHILGFHHEEGGNERRRMRYRERKLLAYVTSLRAYKELTL